jgi:hypothetical protein
MDIMILGVGERLSGGLKDVKGNLERKLWKKTKGRSATPYAMCLSPGQSTCQGENNISARIESYKH